MTSFSIQRLRFSDKDIRAWAQEDPLHRNWPSVYVMNNDKEVYVGESINAESRLRQHLDSRHKSHLSMVRVILDETFNKSATLDLESYLIRMFSGDGSFQVLNRNAGVIDSDYYNRDFHRKNFDEIFESLRQQEHLFKRSIPEIIQSDLFKLSPFKALNHDQAIAIEDILQGFFKDYKNGEDSLAVVQGDPGTGKTVVGIYILKLLADIRVMRDRDIPDTNSMFSEFFTRINADLLRSARVALVVPQQSLRASISKVFEKTPGLDKSQVLTPYQVGESEEKFDLLIVDEAHRLNHRANQASAGLNKKFEMVNRRLFGEDDLSRTQLDWILEQSKHAIFMVDPGQSVRPADLPIEVMQDLIRASEASERHYALTSQMRVSSERDYVGYVRRVLSDSPPVGRENFADYDVRIFSDLGEMRNQLQLQEETHGLTRLVAGYAWPWRSKLDGEKYDIEIEGNLLRWNSTQRDWINSVKSVNEVGSIHTVQGYDLNYVGVIIGKDLKFDPKERRIKFDRSNYFDTKGMENNNKRNITYSDNDIQQYVQNIYGVLMTRGIKGTYIYVCDPALREYMADFFDEHKPEGALNSEFAM